MNQSDTKTVRNGPRPIGGRRPDRAMDDGDAFMVTAPQREREFWDKIAAKDKTEFAALLHPDYVGVYRCGRHTAEEEVASTEDVNVGTASLEDLSVVALRSGAELVSYRLVAKGQTGGREFCVTNNVLTVWVRVGSAWKAIAHSEGAVS